MWGLAGQGLWPAFWLLPNYPWYGGWPHSGEIDIVEHKNLDQTVVTTLHFSKLDGTYAYITSTSTLPDPQVSPTLLSSHAPLVGATFMLCS